MYLHLNNYTSEYLLSTPRAYLATPIQGTPLHDIYLTAALMKIDDLQCVTVCRPANSHRRFGAA
jgi:hypothetical protein